MSKIKKVFRWLFVILMVIIFLLITTVVLYFMIERKGAKKQIEEHMSTHYADLQLQIDDFFMNFPISGYVAKVSSTVSEDVYFDIDYIYDGRIEDTYEEDVLSGRNTLKRVEQSYDELVEHAFHKATVDFTYDMIRASYYASNNSEDPMYIQPRTLQLDYEYDPKELGRKHGRVEIFAYDDDVSYERIEHIILQTKEVLEKGNIPFLHINVTLTSPLDADGVPINNDRLEVYGVLKEHMKEGQLLQYLKKEGN